MRLGFVFFLLVLVASTAYSQRQKRELVYKTYFTSYAADSVPPLWTMTRNGKPVAKPPISTSPRGITHLGRLGNDDKLELKLTQLPRHESLKLRVGFHVIGSWDGEHDQDRLKFMVDDQTFLDATFSNTIFKQSFPSKNKKRSFPARTGARNSNMLAYRFVEPGVFDGFMDATYEIEYEVKHKASEASITFDAVLKDVREGLDNESWGIEHIEVIAMGRMPSADIWPVKLQEHRIYDAEIIEYDGDDVRAIAGYTQDSDLDGIIPGSPWENESHVTLLKTKSMSCGDICLMYNYVIYTDGWVNVWSNREAYGEAMWTTMLTREELDTVRYKVANCLKHELHPEYEAEDADTNPGIPHHEILLRAYGQEFGINFMGGEPAEITETLTIVLGMLKRHGWEPTPYSWD